MRTRPGFETFKFLGDQFQTVLNFASTGSILCFGYISQNTDVAYIDVDGNVQSKTLAATFTFGILPAVIFFSAIISLLYYLGVIQIIVKYLSYIMEYTMGTSSSESLSAAGNIFVSMLEAPLLVKPFLKTMTKSELHAVMTGGFATIAGGALAIYISFGVNSSHLLAASVMSAPAALAISKLIYPETEASPTANSETIKVVNDSSEDVIVEAQDPTQPSNAFHAVCYIDIELITSEYSDKV